MAELSAGGIVYYTCPLLNNYWMTFFISRIIKGEESAAEADTLIIRDITKN